MKLLYLAALVASLNTYAGTISATFTCNNGPNNGSQLTSSLGSLYTELGCTFILTPTTLDVYANIAGFGAGGGTIGGYTIPGMPVIGGIIRVGAFFDLDPLGDTATGFFSASRMTGTNPITTEFAYKLDVAGTYTRTVGASSQTVVLNLDPIEEPVLSIANPEPGSIVLLALGLAAVARRRART